MTKLTPKQEAFCVAYLELGNGTEAYKRAYNAKNMKPESIRVQAAKMLVHPNIALRIDELRAPVVEAARMTLDQHLKNLLDLRDAALSAEKYAAAVTAEVARGKASGFYVDRMEHSGEIGLRTLATKMRERAQKAKP